MLAWSLATGAAVTLSWWGVHTVMTGTAYDPPHALPITAADATTQESKPPAPPMPRPSLSRTPTGKPSPTSTPAPTPSGTPTKSPAPSGSPTASGRIKSYDTDGGRAVFDLGGTSASLVMATPATGWSMQTWKTDTWIRVEFTSGTDKVSVICTWHNEPPRVEVGNY